MKLRSLIPVLDVRNVERSIEFYCEILGFTVSDKVTWGGHTEWALLSSENVQLMLCAAQDDDAEEIARTGEGVFFLHHENLESLLVYLGSKGYEQQPDVLKPEQGGRDFFLRDPDGYVLWFSHKPVINDAKAAQTPIASANGVSSVNGLNGVSGVNGVSGKR